MKKKYKDSNNKLLEIHPVIPQMQYADGLSNITISSMPWNEPLTVEQMNYHGWTQDTPYVTQ